MSTSSPSPTPSISQPPPDTSLSPPSPSQSAPPPVSPAPLPGNSTSPPPLSPGNSTSPTPPAPPPLSPNSTSPPPISAPPPLPGNSTSAPPPLLPGNSTSAPPPLLPGNSTSAPPPILPGNSTSAPPPLSPGNSTSPPSPRIPGNSTSAPPPSSSHVSKPLVTGVVLGAVLALAVLGVIYLCCWRKRRRERYPPPYYGGGPPPPQNGNLGGQPQNWQQNAPPIADHFHKIPPPPSPALVVSHPAHPESQFPYPPTPPIFNSSGGSNNSGSEIRPPPPPPGYAPSFSSKSAFTFEELVEATDGFSDANLLGQGGFGYVHKGTLLDGKVVAVKKLKSGSGQGEREFQAEVEIISRVHHRHLVTLVGYCISGDQRLLVYEYVPNKTLEFHLHGKGQPTMAWSTRLKIALDSAKGLAYLHEDCYPKIIHRDIKAANILLDFNFEAKVADFGLAKFTSDDNTHISTRIMGSFGYIAPEYASSGRLTDKSDVYSFGVMLLELITGKRAYEPIWDDSLVDWARPLLTEAIQDGNCDALTDPRLEKNYNPEEMSHMIASAAACVRHSARQRPRMSQIVRTLEGDMSLEDPNNGVRPGHNRGHSSRDSSDYDSIQHSENMRKFKRLVLGSQEVPSSEYSAPTSEYGQNPSVSSAEGQQTQEVDMKAKNQVFSSSSSS